ncbi:uncharacterized protein [Ptychodera flava]|uniref:uncharacterized protein n=1 Tax=Ptychodera flava TaxID=63121 RepID=UPI00396A1859
MRWFMFLRLVVSVVIPFTAGKTLELTSSDTYVGVLRQIPKLSALTSCIWMKTSASGTKATPVSYATSSHDNQFLMYSTARLKLFIKGTKVTTDLKVDDGQWHHVCVTWSSNGGNWIYYDNGVQYTSGSGLQSGKSVSGGGSLILGQEQDKVGGGFDASQALIGSITGFNLWSRALNNDEIAAVWKDCSIGGDVFAWNVADLNISGDVTETKGDFCDKPAVHKQSEEAGQTLELTSADTYVSALGQIPALAALTSCIWVKTSADGAKATLVSYAASTHDNEFLLYTTSGLKIFVKGTKKTTDLKVDDGKWHHVCVTWTSNGGTWIYYDNGAQYTSGSGLQSGKTITGGGSLILGQEQDKVGGGLDASQALLGSITGFSLWSRTLSGDEVADVFNDCSIGGDVFAWDLSDLYIGGDVLRISDGMCDKPAKGTESPETCVYPVPVSNVAQGKLATQSSDKPNKDGGAEKAVDGNTGGEWKASKSCSWTRRELHLGGK